MDSLVCCANQAVVFSTLFSKVNRSLFQTYGVMSVGFMCGRNVLLCGNLLCYSPRPVVGFVKGCYSAPKVSGEDAKSFTAASCCVKKSSKGASGRVSK